MNTPNLPTNVSELVDHLLDADPDKLAKSAAEIERKWQSACASLARCPEGRRWLALAISRYNFTGSVFTADFQPLPAAYNDGRRAVLSDLLNSNAQASYDDDDD